MLDAYYGYRFGKLEYRSLKFESEVLDEKNHQGVAVVNYTDRETPYTRVIEHKHFEFGTQDCDHKRIPDQLGRRNGTVLSGK